MYPGFWDTAAGGMVAAHESYAESAARELEEELGVSGVELTPHDHFYFEDGDSRLWCTSFSAVWDGPLRIQPEEVMEARFLPLATVLQEAEQKPYCPDAQEGLRRYLALRR
jgi:8-oxo-dGTP pyrophosphatase MutT (NUDIX family)